MNFFCKEFYFFLDTLFWYFYTFPNCNERVAVKGE